MSKKKEAGNILGHFVSSRSIGGECVVDAIIKAVREDLDGDKTANAPPKLTQGYATENWQEIIDGGYLCEGYAQNNIWVPVILKDVSTAKASQFMGNDGYHYSICRPAQIKGVMRPIFVEPVDDSVMVCLFDKDGFQLHDKRSRISWGYYKRSPREFPCATKYIEV